MKANETVKNYPSSLRMYTNYIVREIKKVCKDIGPRESGSQSEKKAQEYIAEQMKTCADEVVTEDFKVHPVAFMAWVVIDGLFVMLAVLFSFLNLPIVSAALTVVALICMAMEFLMYKEFLDPLFPKKTAYNVIGTKKPKGEVKQRIIFSGHVDSAYEWTYTYLGGKICIFAVGGSAVVGMFFVLAVSIWSIIAGGANEGIVEILKYVQLAFIPSFIAVLFFANFKRVVHGANDNLTGTFASVAVLKYLKDNNIELENTEVVAMSSACEECGLRGARDYTKRHLKELQEIPTAFIGMDTLTDYEYIAVYSRDMTGTVKNDIRVCNLIKKGGELADIELKFESVYLGASDAAAVSKLDVPAATLAAMDPGPPRYYHTRLDTPEALKPKTIEKCLDIILNTLFVFDEQGLVDEYK